MDGWLVGKLDRKICKSKEGMNSLVHGWMNFLLGTSSGLKFALNLFPYVSMFYCQHLFHEHVSCLLYQNWIP